LNRRNENERRPDEPSPFRFVGLGFEIAAPLMLGLFGGQWLDRRFGTAPWLLFAGVFSGAAAAGFSLYRRLVAPGRSGRGGSS
jgi:F0F1-type ATP synthase assembly protein I